MTAMNKVFATALAFSLPLAALAQTTPPPETAKPAETAPATAPAAAPAPAPAAKPAEDTIKVTPYGFVLLNAFFDGDTFVNRDYPGAVNVGNAGGAVLFSARQSRLGFRLSGKDKDVTGADLSGVIEVDFKAGHIPAAAGAAPASTAWYNGVMRLRLASATASWKTSYGSWSLLAGQDYGLVNPLFAESLAWVADPLFWQAGNIWRRGPQVRATYAGTFSGVGLTLAVAALSPADAVAGTALNGVAYTTDFGAGNRSRMPDLEGRVALSYKASPELSGTVGVAYDMGTRRLPGAVTPGDFKDVDVSSFGVDVDLNLPYVQLKGEWYQNEGEDDTYNGIISPGIIGSGTASARAINTDGYWAQAILKPLPAISVAIGYGVGNADKGDLSNGGVGAAAATTRTKNTQASAGVFLNAGKFWRLGLEGIKVETTQLGTPAVKGFKDDATQIAFSSQLKF